jgi:methyl-accepting chemotaxis protein
VIKKTKVKKEVVPKKMNKEKDITKLINIRALFKKIQLLNNQLSIKAKLIIAFIVPILFIIFLGAVSFQKAADAIKSNYQKSTHQTINMTGEYIRFGLESILDTSTEYTADKSIASYFSNLYSNDKKKENTIRNDIKTSVISKSAANEFVGDVYFLSDSVSPIIYSRKSAPVPDNGVLQGFMETDRGMQIAQRTMQSIWVGSDTYLDEKLGTQPDTYALRFIRKFHGSSTLLVIDVSKEAVLNILKNMKFSGLLAIVTEDGKELAIGDGQDSIFKKEDFYQKAVAGVDTNGSNYVKYNKEDYLFSYTKIGDTNAMLCALMPKSTITSQTDGIKHITVFIVIIACLVAILTGITISTGIVKTIREIISGLKKAAKGDLTVEFHTKRKDEYKILIDEIQNTFMNMKNLIIQVDTLSHIVSESTEGVNTTSLSFLKSTENISCAIHEIEQGVMQQAKEAEECLVQMDNLSNRIEIVNDKTKEIKEIANSTKVSIIEGSNCTENLNEQTRSTIEITTDIIQSIEQLAMKTHTITEITNVIDDISNQTNLLSLNASIEAARAGQFGRGFSVVADEIRKLAEKSKKSVSDIEQIIQSIQDDTKNVAYTARTAETVLGLQKSAVENTTASYRIINESVEQLIVYLKYISDNVGNIEESRVSTLGAIENISAVLEEIAASTNSVNQAADIQLHSVEDLTGSSQTLSENADELLQAVKKFTI